MLDAVCNQDPSISTFYTRSTMPAATAPPFWKHAMSTIPARIERLPYSSFHRKLLWLGGLGYVFDAMDAAVLAFMLPVLRNQWRA
ncbi:hypothetical protein OKW43_007065 [Paraburkholderia sp. WC7.3g]